MHPVTLPAVAADLAGFLLKTSLGFCLAWAISKVVLLPKRRFLIWLGFLAGAAGYWLWLIAGFVPDGTPLSPSSMPMPLARAGPVGQWQIQPSWAIPLLVIMRGLAALYLFVLVCLLFARVRKHMHLRWVLRFAFRAPEAIEKAFERTAEDLGAGKVRLLVLSGIHSPATFGWMRPTVLLPPFCLEQDPAELRDIFRHELEHVRRRDFALNAVGSFCRALLFFHPAAWCSMRRLELEGELACDLAVVGNTPERRAPYAESLVRFARRNLDEGAKPWNLDFAGSNTPIKVRIRSVLAGTPDTRGWRLGVRTALGLLLILAFLGIAPSLRIALSYQQHSVVQPEKPPAAPSAGVHLPGRVIHRPRTDESAARANRAFPDVALTAPAAAPVRAVANSSPVASPSPAATSSNGPWPTLKRRGIGSGEASPKPAQAIVIPLSNQSSSHPAVTKGRAIASAILAGASEAVSVASHDHDRDSH